MPPRAFVYSWCLDSLNVVLELCYSLCPAMSQPLFQTRHVPAENVLDTHEKYTFVLFSLPRRLTKARKNPRLLCYALRALTSSHLAFSHQQSPCCYITLSLYTLLYLTIYSLLDAYIYIYIYMYTTNFFSPLILTLSRRLTDSRCTARGFFLRTRNEISCERISTHSFQSISYSKV